MGSPTSPHRTGARWSASPSPTPRCGVRCGAGWVGFSGRGGRARPFRTERDREMPQRRAAGAGPAWPRPSWKRRAARSTAPLRPPGRGEAREPGLVPAAQRGAHFLPRTWNRSRAGLAESRAPLESFDSFQIAAVSDVSLRPGVGSPWRRVLREPVGVGGLCSASRRSARPWRAPRVPAACLSAGAEPRRKVPSGPANSSRWSPEALRPKPIALARFGSCNPPLRSSRAPQNRAPRGHFGDFFPPQETKESRARGSRDS